MNDVFEILILCEADEFEQRIELVEIAGDRLARDEGIEEEFQPAQQPA